jgi:hypothetical protein
MASSYLQLILILVLMAMGVTGLDFTVCGLCWGSCFIHPHSDSRLDVNLCTSQQTARNNGLLCLMEVTYDLTHPFALILGI